MFIGIYMNNRSQVSVYRTIGPLVLLAHLVIEPSSVDAFVLSNTNISAISQPITIKFYQKHYWGGGQVALGFVLGRKRTLVSMATDSSHRLTMGKHKKNLLRNFKAQSFYILCVAMYSRPLYKSCQPCPCGSYGPRPGGIMGKTKKYCSPTPQGPELSYFVPSNV